MAEKGLISLLLFMFIALCVFAIRQELINTELKQENALQKAEITELQKKQRLTAQDVGLIEKLIIEGKD